MENPLENEVVEKEETGPSIDETLSATLAEIRTRDEAPEETNDTPETTEPAADRTRDDKGKFAKQAAVVEPAPEPAAEPVAYDVNRPPSSWKAAAKAAYEKVDPTIRAEIHRREADFMKGQAQLLPDAEIGRSIKQIASPYQAMIDAEGGSVQGALQDYLKTASVLRMGTPDQKRNAILGIARQFGVDIGQPAGEANLYQQAFPKQQPPYDPRVDQLLQHFQTQEQQRAAVEKRQADVSVDAWMNENDPKGSPLRPYLENVIDSMQEKIPALRSAHPEWTHTQVLEDAYQRACREDPEVSEVLMSQRLAAEMEKRRGDNLQIVESAKRAAGVPGSKRPGMPTTAPLGTMDQTIRDTYKELMGS